VDSAPTTWGSGDYPAMAGLLEPAALAAVAAAAVGPHDRVLDVATGQGPGKVPMLSVSRSDTPVRV